MIKRKEKILIGALELLEAGGINNVTTKKMADQQGVSEPALYRQYRNKLAIVKSIIEEYASYDDQIMATIDESGMNGRAAVLFYVQCFAELYMNYSEITTVMFSMDVYFYEESSKKMMKIIQDKRLAFLERIIREGQTKGSIAAYYPPDMLAEMIDGMIYTQIYRWRMNDKEGRVDCRLVDMAEHLL